MKTVAIVEMWDDKTISVYVPEFDGFNLNGQGKALMKQNDHYMNVLMTILPCLKSKVMKCQELKNVEFEYKYDIASFFDNFKFISVSTFAKYAGINPSLMRQYKQRIAFASEAQKLR